MRARKTVLAGLIVVLMVALVGCGGDDDDERVLGGQGTADLVVTDEFPFYEPTTLEIARNQEVTFTVFNDGERIHNITIPDFAIDMDVAPKQTISVKVPAVSGPGRDGFYTVYCKYHQADGEALRLTVAD